MKSTDAASFVCDSYALPARGGDSMLVFNLQLPSTYVPVASPLFVGMRLGWKFRLVYSGTDIYLPVRLSSNMVEQMKNHLTQDAS